MDQDTVAAVEIDETGRLLVFPSNQTFAMIYREAVEVHWDPKLRALYSPEPREWGYSHWFRHILDTAGTLHVTPETQWRNIDPALKEQLLAVTRNGA